MDNREEIKELLGGAFNQETTEDRLDMLEQAIIDIDNVDSGELAEIRSALVELAEIVIGGE